jgi:HD superfamily phosphohydrolase
LDSEVEYPPATRVDGSPPSSEGAAILALPSADPGIAFESEIPAYECFIAIHKFARLTKREMEILAHPACQRLRNIYQLGQTHLVYPSATHRRFEHALGCLFVAQLIIDTLDRNSGHRGEEREVTWRLDERLDSVEIAFIRLGALLHDIGHLPMGHTFEDELGLFAAHDADERLNAIFDRRDWHVNASRDSMRYAELANTLQASDTSLRSLVDELYGDDAERTGFGVTATETVFKLISKDHAGDPTAVCPGFRLQVCRDLIGNTICADILDYLHRDWHHMGKHKELDLRLVDYMELRRDTNTGESALVVSLRNPANVRSDGVSAILDLLESRYNLFEIALYHKTKLCATAMLERVVGELHDAHAEDREEWLDALLGRLIDSSDESMLDMLGEEAYALLQHPVDGPVEEDAREVLRNIARTTIDLGHRKLHKVVYHATHYELRSGEPDRVRDLYAPTPRREPAGVRPPGASTTTVIGGASVARTNRMAAMRQLEHDFKLPPLSMAMYCATRETSMKVADVKILFDDKVRTLWEHEDEDDHNLTGGHLTAQSKRFKGLWRVLVACDENTLNDLRCRDLDRDLVEAIRWGVLGLGEDDRGVGVARELARKAGSPWHGWDVDEQMSVRSDDAGSTMARYPTGRCALRTFLGDPGIDS